MPSLLPTRRASHPHPKFIPFREHHSKAIHYAPNPSLSVSPIENTSSTNSLSQFTYLDPPSPEHEDSIPLIPTTTTLPQDAYQHFTATGRPLEAHKTEMGHMFTAPVLLPMRYTDESIIPAIVTRVLPSQPKPEHEGKKSKFLKKLRDIKSRDENEDGTMTKVVFMPRREHLRWFARDKDGGYVGTEPWKQWSEEDLEREFGRFRPEVRGRWRRVSAGDVGLGW